VVYCLCLYIEVGIILKQLLVTLLEPNVYLFITLITSSCLLIIDRFNLALSARVT
jgi:hypothetical protein